MIYLPKEENHLSALLSPESRLNLPETIKNDMKDFLSRIDEPEKYTRIAEVYI
jgi:hypothetical protein